MTTSSSSGSECAILLTLETLAHQVHHINAFAILLQVKYAFTGTYFTMISIDVYILFSQIFSLICPIYQLIEYNVDP